MGLSPCKLKINPAFSDLALGFMRQNCFLAIYRNKSDACKRKTV